MSAEDRLLVQMQGVIAEYERAKILERTRRGKLHKLRSGQLCPYPSVAPYGYALAMAGEPAKKIVVIDEVEATHVRAMFSHRRAKLRCNVRLGVVLSIWAKKAL